MYPTVGLPQGGMIQFLKCIVGQLNSSASNVLSQVFHWWFCLTARWDVKSGVGRKRPWRERNLRLTQPPLQLFSSSIVS